MKKLLSLVLALLMVMGSVAFAEDLSGTWYADMFGMPVTLVLNADGTYSMEVMGEADNGTWVQENDAVVMDKGTEAEMPLVYDAAANPLTVAIEGMELVFAREAAEAFVPAEIKADAVIEEFAGSWEAENVYFMEMLVPVDFAEMSLKLEIEGNIVSMIMNVMGGEETVEGIECIFEDGALKLLVPASYNDAGMQLTEEIVYAMNVLQDGTLSFQFDMMGMPIIFYLNPVAAEEIPAA